jgi:hypothetical protein
VTIERPTLTPDELRDARDAWALVQLGQPVPTMYRPAALKAARYAFARGYDHDDVAAPRPLFLHPDGGHEGAPGVYGKNRTWTAPQLAAWIAENVRGVKPKGTGPMYSPGHSWRGDDSDEHGEVYAGAYPMAPHQRGDERCRAIGWLFFDADASGDWHALSDALGAQGAAFVRSRSSGHCTRPTCADHPQGAAKWHLALPLREIWTPTGNLNIDRARWKADFYTGARFAMHLAGDLTGRGFDRELAQMLCRMYAGAPRDPMHGRVDREVLGRDGLGFDVEACLGALEELGVVDPAPVRAARTAEQFAPGRAWNLDDGTPPMVAAFLVAGLHGHQLANGNHAVICPWESLHSGGESLDTSTVLFPNGKFHCSHGHAEGKAAGGVGMREVLATLPAEAQAAHRAARQQARTAAQTAQTAQGETMGDGGMVGGELSALLADLAADPDIALSDAFIARVAALSAADQAKVHARVKELKVPARPFNTALSAALKARRREEDRAAAVERVEQASARKPRIMLGPDEDRVADEAVVALARHPGVYQRGGALVYVVADQSPLRGVTRPAGASRIAPLPLPTLREYLSGAAIFTTEGEDGPRVVHVPTTCVQAVAARGQWKGLRALEGIVDCPMLRPDGSVITEPGYDPATGVIYTPSQNYPAVPEKPSLADARAAISLLADLFCDFPFRTPAHASAAIAALMTPLAVYAFAGPKPLFLFDANTAGAGKGKCVGIISEVVAGRPIAVMAPVEDDAEQRKRITALAIEGATLVLIDNIVGSLGGPSMDAALTATEWSDRILGSSTTVKLPLAITWYATGNNVSLIGDMQRRVLHVRLESPEANPEDRTGFRHEDVEGYARAHRAQLVVAALTVLRAFILAGRPRHGLSPWGSFSGWSGLIRGAIVWAGLADPAETRQELRAEADFTAGALRGLIAGWPEVARRYGGHCTAAQALRELDRDDRDAFGSQRPVAYAALREALAELIATAPGKLPSTRQLGGALRMYKGRVVRCGDGATRALSLVKKGEDGAVWCVRETAPSTRPLGRGAADPDYADSPDSVSGYPVRGQHAFAGERAPAHVNARVPGVPGGWGESSESAQSGSSGADPTFDPDPDLGWGAPAAEGLDS